jgi:hypothetical protein
MDEARVPFESYYEAIVLYKTGARSSEMALTMTHSWDYRAR